MARDFFKGDLVNIDGNGKTRNGVFKAGGECGSRGADETQVFAISMGREADASFAFIFRPRPNVQPGAWDLTDDTIVESWLWTGPLLRRTPSMTTFMRNFVDSTPEQRRAIEGALKLKGKVHVNRFRSTVDFDIDVDVQTETEPPRKIKGNFQMNHPRPADQANAGAEVAIVQQRRDVAANRGPVAERDFFKGDVVNIDGKSKTRSGVFELGGQSSGKGKDGTLLFALDMGVEADVYFVFIYHPRPGIPDQAWDLNDETLNETWIWTAPLVKQHFKKIVEFAGKFIDSTPDQRRAIEGALPLKGKVHVMRFASNIDFDIDVDVQTETDPPRKIKGNFQMNHPRPADRANAKADAAAPPNRPGAAKQGADVLSAVRLYAEGLRDGDEKKLRTVVQPAAKDAQPMVDLIVQWAKGSVRLERAATKKFGRDAAERIVGALFIPSAGSRGRGVLENVEDAEVKVQGDTATVGIDPIGRIDLQRVGGEWKIVVPVPPKKGDDGQLRLMKAAVAAQDEIAPKIEAGKYATADAAANAVEQAMSKIADAPENARK